MPDRYRLNNLPLPLAATEAQLAAAIARQIGVAAGQVHEPLVVRRALDARQKRNIHHVCSVEFALAAPPKRLPAGVEAVAQSALDVPRPDFLQRAPRTQRVAIVGAGPAGLFAALALAEAVFTVSLFERGQPVELRMRDIGRLRSRGELNPESNICFGEGGAGTYTDGKLYTRIKHPLLRWVLAEFVRFGANPEILIDAHPHLGTDKLVRIVRAMRQHLLALGVEYRFGARVDDLLLGNGGVRGVRLANGEEIVAEHVVLATGHSARDTFARLLALGLPLESKPFAVGVRAEHPQALIDAIQFGLQRPAQLPAAEYSVTHQADDPYLGQRGIYSFCMCPGGLIVPSPTEEGMSAINGMSNARRSGRFANSGVVVQVTPDDLRRHGIGDSPLAGIEFQRQLERAAFLATTAPYAAPAMRLTDFVARRASGTLAASSYKPGIEPFDLWQLFPEWLASPLADGLRGFDRKMRGYVTAEANLLGVESRTSSPVRIVRGESMQVPGFAGLYPIGEGAGYAGGIVSAAVDGLKAAEQIIAGG